MKLAEGIYMTQDLLSFRELHYILQSRLQFTISSEFSLPSQLRRKLTTAIGAISPDGIYKKKWIDHLKWDPEQTCIVTKIEWI